MKKIFFAFLNLATSFALADYSTTEISLKDNTAVKKLVAGKFAVPKGFENLIRQIVASSSIRGMNNPIEAYRAGEQQAVGFAIAYCKSLGGAIVNVIDLRSAISGSESVSYGSAHVTCLDSSLQNLNLSSEKVAGLPINFGDAEAFERLYLRQ